jgi:hypothetical protein
MSPLPPASRPWRLFGWLVACYLVGVGLAGCALPTPQGPAGPIRSFVLTARPPADPLRAAASQAVLASSLIGVQTVQIPDYLAQRPIVTRSEGNQIQVSENAQWAGDLSANITDVIVANLGMLVGSNRVLRLPVSQAVPVETIVGIEVARFEHDPAGSVQLAARWIVLGDGGRSFRLIDYGSYEALGVGGDYPAITAAMSDLLAALSADIVRSLVAAQDRPAVRPAAEQSDRRRRPAL